MTEARYMRQIRNIHGMLAEKASKEYVDSLVGETLITNLCTDPKPVDLLTWTDDATPTGGTTAMDATYAGTSFRVDPNVTFGYGFAFSLPSTGPLANVVPDPIDGTTLIPIGDADLKVAFNVRHANSYTAYARLTIHDASGVDLGVAPVSLAGFVTGGTDSTWVGSLGDWGQPKPGGATNRSVWGIDVGGLLEDYPDAVYAGLRFSIGQPALLGELSGPVYLGNGSIYAANVAAYGDADTDGWVDNGDGTSTGPMPAFLTWDEIDHPDTFPPSDHDQPASTITDLATVVKAYTLDEFANPVVDVDMDAHKIIDLADGTNPQDAATVAQLDAATSTVTVPLTTVVGGVPELVWDADNQLVLTEVPL
ncbi:hypothetical protein [Aeromicrobium sp.]|uniref:hypothetical protein n=1 Tax=Aeromicrobium sp. TaxID=1871063 RepID=UPI002FC84846